jgi:hypothetical protein
MAQNKGDRCKVEAEMPNTYPDTLDICGPSGFTLFTKTASKSLMQLHVPYYTLSTPSHVISVTSAIPETHNSFLFLAVLGFEFRALCMPGRHSTT